MSKFKVKITKTQICETILQADDKEDLQDVVNTAIANNVFSFDKDKNSINVEVVSVE